MRIGSASPSNPRTRSVGRATSLTGRTYGLTVNERNLTFKRSATDEQSAGRKPADLGEATRDLLSRDPEGLKGRDVADFGLGIGGSAATQPKKHRRTQRQDDWGLPRSFRNYWRRHFRADPARILSLIYAANLRLRAP